MPGSGECVEKGERGKQRILRDLRGVMALEWREGLLAATSPVEKERSATQCSARRYITSLQSFTEDRARCVLERRPHGRSGTRCYNTKPNRIVRT